LVFHPPPLRSTDGAVSPYFHNHLAPTTAKVNIEDLRCGA
jgi:hypothetical protein